MTEKALVLVNLGTTASTQVADVRDYLDEFLMDPYVIDFPWPLRRFIVSNILRKRPQEVSKAYQSIWWEQGSPLMVLSQRLQQKVAQQWHEGPVELAMRYGEPSIDGVLTDLAQRGIKDIVLAPLYPQYAESTVRTVIEQAERVIKKRRLNLNMQILPPYYENPDYIETLANSIRPYMQQEFDHLLLSYHGLPERHIHKTDPTGCHCLKSDDCCQTASDEILKKCYRAQSWRSSKAVTQALSLTDDKWSMSFQSRLGKAKWIEPYTDVTLEKLATKGKKKILVACPAFAADCIETLEEIEMEGKEIFQAAGGEQLTLVPCLNDQDEWVATLVKLCREIATQQTAAA